ncbi:N-acyl amino acid synthase FeeM domain-containing protein [Methyloversatilis thermotolerans]|uniref:N-acyl amino acid synthase FeeM domain-containing protein n=1 Tax=Methyloversatilis thermotolerans TaxID=1346290 RepID=UPI0003A6A828|nr:hypothetical protein [Methyloversatilis thermotolerans]
MSPRTTGHDAANDSGFSSPSQPIEAHAAPVRSRVDFVIATLQEELAEAWELVARCYAWRGYDAPMTAEAAAGETTLLARIDGRVVGTLTVRSGTRLRLQAETAYSEHVEALRASGRRLVEYTRFAIDREQPVPDNLPSELMRRALLLAHISLAATDCVIEVNPRHARYYRREFGFREFGPETRCPRVGAPAKLLHVNLAEPLARLNTDNRPSLH